MLSLRHESRIDCETEKKKLNPYQSLHKTSLRRFTIHAIVKLTIRPLTYFDLPVGNISHPESRTEISELNAHDVDVLFSLNFEDDSSTIAYINICTSCLNMG